MFRDEKLENQEIQEPNILNHPSLPLLGILENVVTTLDPTLTISICDEIPSIYL